MQCSSDIQIDYPGSGDSTKFTYDAAERCVKREEYIASTLSSTEQGVWFESECLEARDASGAIVNRFSKMGQTNGSSLYFYTVDHLGSIRHMTDNTGAIVASYDFDLFGRVSRSQSSINPAKGFAGFRNHERSSLYLALHRAYNPSTSAWLSRDPIGVVGGNNAYSYAANNPISLTDPLGLTVVSNFQYFVEFVQGAGSSTRNYPADDFRTKEVIDSPLGDFARSSFYGNKCAGYDKKHYGTFQAAQETGPLAPWMWGNTATQIGGADVWATKSGNSVTFKIRNVTGLRSLLLDLPAVHDVPSGPFRSITQIFTWKEDFKDCDCYKELPHWMYFK